MSKQILWPFGFIANAMLGDRLEACTTLGPPAKLGPAESGRVQAKPIFNNQKPNNSNYMKITARNILKGKIKSVKKGPISSIVILEVAPGVEIVSSVTSDSVSALKLKKGQAAYAIIKASSVLVGVD
jgi:molybdopterin-binding protein